MLVLTRRKDETILILGSIRVTVLSIAQQQVKLGIQAPPEVDVQRLERCEKPRDTEPNT